MAQKKKAITKKSTSQRSNSRPSKSTTLAKKATANRQIRSDKTTTINTTAKNNSTSPARKISFSRRLAVIIGIIIIAIGILYILKGLYFAAMVDGQPISRLAVIHQLEQQNGKKTLDSLITQKLIENEANKRNINVSQKDTDGQINKIESSLKQQGTSLDAALAQQGMSRDELNTQVKLQLMLQKMIKPVTVTDKDIANYISQNQSQLPQGADPTQLKSQVKQQLEQEKQQQEIQDFVANLKKNAHISYFVNY